MGSLILGVVIHIKKYELVSDAFVTNSGLRWIPVVAFLIYFVGYSTGYVAVCFMLLGELLPSNGKEIGGFIIVQSTNISSIILIKCAPDLQTSLGVDGMFFLFSGVAAFAIIFTLLCVPETFGKTLEEMEDHYRKICYKHSVVNSNAQQQNINQSFVLD